MFSSARSNLSAASLSRSGILRCCTGLSTVKSRTAAVCRSRLNLAAR